MAYTRFTLPVGKYAQIELNQVAFRRDGRIEAQCKLDGTDFATVPAENGMLLAVDNVTRTIKFPTASDDFPLALNYTTEHMYDERADALSNYATWKYGKDPYKRGHSYLPRLGYLDIGDKFTTNAVCYDTDDFDDDDALLETDLTETTIYASEYTGNVATCKGLWKFATEKPTAKVVAKVVKIYDMPDGTPGFKLQVIE